MSRFDEPTGRSEPPPLYPGIIAAADQTGPDLPVAAVRVGRGRVLASLRRHCKIIAAMCAANSNLKLTLRG